MSWPLAAFPMPRSKRAGIGITLRTLPVKMNVLDAVSGRSLNPRTACCAATRTLVVLTAMLRSRESTLNVFDDVDSGSSPSTGEAVEAVVTSKLGLTSVHVVAAFDSPLYITTLGIPAVFLTSLKRSTTEAGRVRSVAMCGYFCKSSFLLAVREETRTWYPFALKARAQLKPTLGPAPMMSAIGRAAMVTKMMAFK